MIYSDVEKAVYNWVSDNVSVPVIFFDENGVRPNLPYVTINITSYNMIGQRYLESPDNNGDRNIKYTEDFTVAINSFGRGSQDELQKLKDSLQKEIVLQSLKDACIAVRNESTITDISVLVDSTIEKRFFYEIFLSFGKSIEENVGYIEDYELFFTINQP